MEAYNVNTTVTGVSGFKDANGKIGWRGFSASVTAAERQYMRSLATNAFHCCYICPFLVTADLTFIMIHATNSYAAMGINTDEAAGYIGGVVGVCCCFILNFMRLMYNISKRAVKEPLSEAEVQQIFGPQMTDGNDDGGGGIDQMDVLHPAALGNASEL